MTRDEVLEQHVEMVLLQHDRTCAPLDDLILLKSVVYQHDLASNLMHRRLQVETNAIRK